MKKEIQKVVAALIVSSDGKILLAKKRPLPRVVYEGVWVIPGGVVDSGETNEEALQREVLEETNLKIKNIKYLTSLVFERDDNIPVVVISLYADPEEGEIKLSKEMTEYKWVTLQEAKNHDLIEGIYEELIMLDKILKGQQAVEWSKE